jgi:hypothetical protein
MHRRIHPTTPERTMFNTSSRLDQRFVGVLFFVWSVAGASAVGLAAFDPDNAASSTVSARAATASAPVTDVTPNAVVAIASAR